MNYISIGGWCGTKIVMKLFDLFNEESLPFDSVRTSLEGVINCIETDFQHFFPKKIVVDPNIKTYNAFLGKYVGFFHNTHNLLDKNVISSFDIKFERFKKKLSQKGNFVFIRSIVRDNYLDEIILYKKLQNAIENKYPNIKYIIVFIIPNQKESKYYKNIDDKTFLFTLNDSSINYENITYDSLREGFAPIIEFIKVNNLFQTIPKENPMTIVQNKSRLWTVDGVPMVNHYEEL